MKKNTEIQKIKEDVEIIKNDVAEIKDMLKQLIDNNKSNDINKEIISKIDTVISNTRRHTHLGFPG